MLSQKPKAEPVVAVGFNSAGRVAAVTSADYELALRTARYYRSIGYRSRVMPHEALAEVLEKEREDRELNRVYSQID